MHVADHNDDKNYVKVWRICCSCNLGGKVLKFYRAGTKENTYLYFAVIIHSTFVNLSKDDSYVQFKFRSAA